MNKLLRERCHPRRWRDICTVAKEPLFFFFFARLFLVFWRFSFPFPFFFFDSFIYQR